jgi:hypothetical protein
MLLEDGKIYLVSDYESLYRIDYIDECFPARRSTDRDWRGTYIGDKGNPNCGYTVLATKNPTWVFSNYRVVPCYKTSLTWLIAIVKKEISREELPLYINWPYINEHFTKELSGV